MPFEVVSLQVLSPAWRRICADTHPTCSRGKSDRMGALSSSTIKMASNSCMSAQLNRLPTRKSSPWSFKIYRKERHILMEVMMICPSECLYCEAHWRVFVWWSPELARTDEVNSLAHTMKWRNLFGMSQRLSRPMWWSAGTFWKAWREREKTVPASTGIHGS